MECERSLKDSKSFQKEHNFSHIFYGNYLQKAAKDNDRRGMYYAIAYALALANFFSLFVRRADSNVVV